MSPDWESNAQPFSVCDNIPTNNHLARANSTNSIKLHSHAFLYNYVFGGFSPQSWVEKTRHWEIFYRPGDI